MTSENMKLTGLNVRLGRSDSIWLSNKLVSIYYSE